MVRNVLLSSEAFTRMNATPNVDVDPVTTVLPDPPSGSSVASSPPVSVLPMAGRSVASSAYTAHEATHWGRNHPNYGTTRSRAEWSEAEISYIGDWFKNHAAMGANLNASRCLKHIWADANSVDIFHAIHVLDSGRLRCGVDKYLRSVNQSA